MNIKIITSLLFAGIVTVIAGCDDASKPSDTVKQAEEKAQQLQKDGEQALDELTENAKNKTEELKQNTAELGQEVKTNAINKADEMAAELKETTGSLKADNDPEADKD